MGEFESRATTAIEAPLPGKRERRQAKQGRASFANLFGIIILSDREISYIKPNDPHSRQSIRNEAGTVATIPPATSLFVLNERLFYLKKKKLGLKIPPCL